MAGKRSKRRRASKTMAARADRHDLYQRSVQEPEVDVEFAVDTFRAEFGRRPYRLREDFCGTAALCAAWVREHHSNRAWGVDLDPETMKWGRRRNIDPLPGGPRRRVELTCGDVREVAPEPVDVVMAQNFSYFLFEQRGDLLGYFRAAHRNLRHDGLLILDAYGGPDSIRRVEEATEYDDFTYVWDQDDFDPITQRATCYIHFDFPDGSRLERAFTYLWRMYTIPEIRDLLADAGFSASDVYWEGTDSNTGEGDGLYTVQEHGEADEAWVCYIVGIKR